MTIFSWLADESISPGALLNMLIFLPLAGMFLLFFLPSSSVRYLTLFVTFFVFILSLLLYFRFDPGQADLQMVFTKPWLGYLDNNLNRWVSSYDIKYQVGVDGLSIYLVLLTTLLFPVCILSSWNSVTQYTRAYYSLMLLLESSILGVFVSLDLILFYVFFEMGLIPMYFLIGIWGGKNRIYASVKFFLYTLFGSLLMLLGILYLGHLAGEGMNGGIFTTDYFKIRNFRVPDQPQMWLFLAFTLSFCIKVPLFPLHTWLPDAHTEAPTSGSVILAGVLLKMGTYGLIRFCLPLFPQASLDFAPLIATLAVIGIVYGAIVSSVQTDIKRLVAFSSVSHLGFVVLGIFAFNAEAMRGAVLQTINHGISTGALFLLVGMLYDRAHTREIKDFQGIARIMPAFTLMLMITGLASIGLPGLNGFTGEFLILLGTFNSPSLANQSYAVIAATGVVFAAVYILWMFRKVLFGTVIYESNRVLTDIDRREIILLLPLILLMFWIGLHASYFLDHIGNSSDALVKQIENAKFVTDIP